LPGTLELLVLAVLLDGPRHAYGLARAIDETSANVLSVPEGSLFPCLKRLAASGCVQGEGRTVDGRRRVVYSITGTGRMRFERAHKAWLRVASAVDQVVQRYT
jgi:DNA-binding PadR family transcriptional regulator